MTLRVLHVPADFNLPAEELEIEPSLDEFQRLVGGMMTCLPGEHPGYANENGLLLALPYNIRASTISDYHLVGDVVYTGGISAEGDDLDVPAEFVKAWFR